MAMNLTEVDKADIVCVSGTQFIPARRDESVRPRVSRFCRVVA